MITQAPKHSTSIKVKSLSGVVSPNFAEALFIRLQHAAGVLEHAMCVVQTECDTFQQAFIYTLYKKLLSTLSLEVLVKFLQLKL